MGLGCVEQRGCGLPGRATAVQSSRSATRPAPLHPCWGGVFLGVPPGVTRCLLLCKEGAAAFKDHVQENLC